MIYGIWLHLWLDVIRFNFGYDCIFKTDNTVLRFTASDYIFLFWLWLYCLSYDLRHLITSVYFGYDCIVCLKIYGIWLHLFNLAMIDVLSVLRFTASDYIFFILAILYCLSYDLRHLITSFYFGYDCIVCLKIYGIWLHLFILAIVLSVLRFTASDYIFLFWLWLYCLS